MYTVAESAEILGVSEVRVRQLAAAQALAGSRHGNAWMLDEASVWDRATRAKKAGRPRKAEACGDDPDQPAETAMHRDAQRIHELYLECQELLGQLPPLELLEAVKSGSEASFCMAVFDFFAQQKQVELVRQGVF